MQAAFPRDRLIYGPLPAPAAELSPAGCHLGDDSAVQKYTAEVTRTASLASSGSQPFFRPRYGPPLIKFRTQSERKALKFSFLKLADV